jgi:hypothetical protein
MPTPTTTGRSSSVFLLLNATKKFLQDVTVDTRFVWDSEMDRIGGLMLVFRITTAFDEAEVRRTNKSKAGLTTDVCYFQLDVLEQDASEILRLIRSWKNRLAPVNRVPPEILALIPDFWKKHYDDTDRNIIALTHVCQAWREVFISRSSLWTDLDCNDMDQARVYLERSKPLPVKLLLDTSDVPFPHHPLFEIIPHAIGRLGTLTIEAVQGDLQDITARLTHPAPLLEQLSINGYFSWSPHSPVLAPTLFNGDLSSLRKLCLEYVCTELPWRDMVNLTSFTLTYVSPDEIPIRKLLDFFESAPRLREVDLCSPAPTSGVQNDRLVPLACLERMVITDHGFVSLLLNHLLIPVGTHLTIDVDPVPSLPSKDNPPRFLGNLRNFLDFTTIHLSGDWGPHMEFSGPNGQVRMIPRSPRLDKTCLVFEHLDQFDMSEVEQLTIYRGFSPSSDPPYQALLPMKRLRTLTLRECARPHTFVHALHPNTDPSGRVICPKLEELVVLDGMALDMKNVIGVAAARASEGMKLKSVRIFGQDKFVRTDVLELKKHVFHVECGPEVDEANDDIDEED